MIVLAPYDAAWPARFDAEAALLRQAFGALALRVDHVGSTAVPGLAAKPVIDLQLSVRRLAPRDAFDAALARLGYRHVPLGDFDSVYPFCGCLSFSLHAGCLVVGFSCREHATLKVRCDREQTAHLQTALLHRAVRTQIRTAQPGSILCTRLGTIAAASG